MAISTYSELQTAVQNWLDDTNAIPAARVQEFIALAEADLNRRLRTRSQVTLASDATAAGVATIALPSGFAGVRTLALESGYGVNSLEVLSPSAALDAYLGYGNGVPEHYTIEGGNIRLFPTPDSGYTYYLYYYKRVPALSDAAPTNWLLTTHPDAYLFGALVMAKGFLMDDERVAVWRAQYDAVVEQLGAESINDSWGQSPLMITEGSTP